MLRGGEGRGVALGEALASLLVRDLSLMHAAGPGLRIFSFSLGVAMALRHCTYIC